MSHLGQRLSALIDGELGAAERDRVLAHLARCDTCRREAVALRALKQRMHSLGEAMVDTALTGRLMAMAAAGEDGATRAGWRPRAVYAAARWMAVGLAASVMAAVGAAAFFVGGEQQDPGPKVTPAVDSFLVQHGSVTGDVPVAPTPAAAPGATAAASAVSGRVVRAAADGALAGAAPAPAPAATATVTAPRAASRAAVSRRTAARATQAARPARASATASATRPATPRKALLRPARRAAAGQVVATASPGP